MFRRDAQRSRVYRAEDKVPRGQDFTSKSQVEVFLTNVFCQPWFQSSYPEARSHDVKFKSFGRFATGSGRLGICTLNLPPWARCERVILHELAHGLVDLGHPRRVAIHGPEFCSVYLDLVQRVMGRESGQRLRKAFREQGVRYFDPQDGLVSREEGTSPLPITTPSPGLIAASTPALARQTMEGRSGWSGVPAVAGEVCPPLTLGPTSLDEFVGQRSALEQLRMALECARRENRPLEPLLITGPSGCGKTTLASLVGQLMDSHPALYRASSTYMPEMLEHDALRLTRPTGHRPLLILDELHALSPKTRDALLIRLSQLAGEAPGDGSLRASALTVCGLTNRTLTEALQRRFPNRLTLGSFSPQDLAQIIEMFARQSGVPCQPAAAQALAQVAVTPGRARRLFTQVRHRAVAQDRPLDESVVRETLEVAGIEVGTGLDQRHLELLKYLRQVGSASRRALCIRLGIDDEGAYGELEQLLMQLGYLVISSRGRQLTPTAIAFLDKL